MSTRRNLLQGAGVLAATAAAHVSVTRASAQGIQDTKDTPGTDELNIIDWHCHHVPARFELTALSMAPPSQRARWEAIERKLRDEDLMVKDTRDGVLGARVINIPANLIADANGLVARPTLEVASRLGVPVFIHPVAPQPLTKQ